MRLTMTLVVAAAALSTGLPALAQSAQSAQSPAMSAPASATATTLSVGLPVKDKTGVVIGQIADLKSGASGQTATVKMGDQAFAIGAQSFVVQNGAAVINATQAELKAMIASAAKPAG